MANAVLVSFFNAAAKATNGHLKKFGLPRLVYVVLNNGPHIGTFFGESNSILLPFSSLISERFGFLGLVF